MDDASNSGAFAPLSGDFPAAAREDWEALAAKALKGAPLSTLQRRGFDGLIVQPLYTRSDAARSLAPMRRETWDIRVGIPSTADAPSLALEALAGGASSLLVEAHDGGEMLERTLADVLLDVAPVALDAGFAGPAAARALSAVAKASPAAPLAFHLDPLSALARAGASPGPIANHLSLAARTAAALSQTHPGASLFLASGLSVHEAGGSPAQELAFALACALAYAKALTAAGRPSPQTWAGIVVELAAEAQPLTAIPKLRAARALWKRVTEACGAATPLRLQVRSSGRMLTRADPATNLVRLTAAGFSAVIGGAGAIILDPFDGAVSESPSPLARRQSRNIQLILAEESGLVGADDPAAGAWALEALADETARAAWSEFQAIERLGGATAALVSGHVARNAEAARDELRERLENRSLRLVGVTDFTAADAPAGATPPSPRVAREGARLDGPDTLCEFLAPLRLEDLA